MVVVRTITRRRKKKPPVIVSIRINGRQYVCRQGPDDLDERIGRIYTLWQDMSQTCEMQESIKVKGRLLYDGGLC
jgi:hypothetical protein